MPSSPPKKKEDDAGAPNGTGQDASEDTHTPNAPDAPHSPDVPSVPEIPSTPDPPATPGPPATPDPDADADAKGASPDRDPGADSDPDWCEEEVSSEPDSGSESESDSESEAALIALPHKRLGQLLDDFFLEDREYAPLELAPLLREVSVRDVRRIGVKKMKEAIECSGWIRSSLMIAHDRGDGRPPVLLEGAHRAKALMEIFRKEDRAWPDALPKDLKVKVKILKGLSPSEEKQIGRECNYVHSKNVSMSLVDQVVAMWYALKTCREQGNFSPEQRKIPMSFLLHLHPDYDDRSSVRRWKQLAEGFGEEAMAYLRDAHRTWAQLGDDGTIKRAFSTKTLLESHVTTVLEKNPGPQVWYLRRMVDVETEGELKHHDARWCEELAHRLKSIADICEDFADLVDRKCPHLSRFGRALRFLVHKGVPSQDPEIRDEFVAKRLVELFEEFAESYLYTTDHEEEWKEACQLHAGDSRFYPKRLQELLAATCFAGDEGKVKKALDFSRDFFFCAPPRKGIPRDVEPPHKKLRMTKRSSQKKQQEQDQVEFSEEESQGHEEREKKKDQKARMQLPQQEEEISPHTQEAQKQLPVEEGISPIIEEFTETKFEVRVKHLTSKRGLPNEVFKIVQDTLQESTFTFEEGEEVQVIRND